MELAERAEEIVSRLTMEEKLYLTSGRDFWHLEPLETEGIPSIMITDGPHGLRKQREDADHLGISDSVSATCFPVAATLASTWDEDLIDEVGAALGRESRAEDVSLVLGPGLNLKRHPFGGRNFEYFSEDPFLSGKLAAALVRGIQSEGVGACLKHFVANNQETRRMTVDTLVDERTLRELYLAGFEIAVRESSPWSLMCAYNRLNGTYASDSRWLLTDVLREEWGFDGFVVSDWGGMNTKAGALGAGMDLEMPGNGHAWDGEALEGLASGVFDHSDLHRSATRIVEFMLRAGDAAGGGEVDFESHHALGRRAAAAGTVLLTNDGTLPLVPDASVALIGALAERPRYQGAGSSLVNPTRLDTVLGSFSSRAGITYARGYEPLSGKTSSALVAEAVAAAAEADVAVVVVGLPSRYESEGFDRTTLSLPEGHDAVVAAVVAAGTPTVVVLVNGAPVHIPWADRPAAIVEAYLGGQAAGSAIVDVLMGDAEPGGRLAESFPVAVTDLPAHTNFPGSGRRVVYRETFHVGYRFHDSAGVPARFPFGHGLSYTSFDLGTPRAIGDAPDVTIELEVTNTGARRGSQVVQVYIRDPDSSVPKPDKELKGFAKVELDPGETETVSMELDRRSFSHWQPGTGWVVEEGEFEILVATSSVDVHHSLTVDVPSSDEITSLPGTAAPLATDIELESLLGHPVPEPEPARPFHRNSSVEEAAETLLGKLLEAGMARAVSAQLGDGEDDDGVMALLIESALAEAPLRGLVGLSGGRISPAALDRLIAALNGRWATALGRRRTS